MEYLSDSPLSPSAEELVRFDMDSLRQLAVSQRASAPAFWLANPVGYERNGRVLRDSASLRLLAYAPPERALYATDGCNSCNRRLPLPLEQMSDAQLQTFAAESEFPLDLLRGLAARLG